MAHFMNIRVLSNSFCKRTMAMANVISRFNTEPICLTDNDADWRVDIVELIPLQTENVTDAKDLFYQRHYRADWYNGAPSAPWTVKVEFVLRNKKWYAKHYVSLSPM